MCAGLHLPGNRMTVSEGRKATGQEGRGGFLAELFHFHSFMLEIFIESQYSQTLGICRE